MNARRRHNLTEESSPRRWARRGSTLFWVVLATILVWVYADLEFTKTDELAVTIRLTAASQERALLSPRRGRKVVFELRGNRRALDVFLGKHNNAVLTYDVSKRLDPGRNKQVRTTEILYELLDLEERGISVRSANPEFITGIDIDPRIRKMVPVEFVFGKADFARPPPEGTMVGVWAAESDWKRIKEKTKQPVLRTVKKELRDEPKGVSLEMKMEIVPRIADIPVEPEQTTVPVTVVISDVVKSQTFRVAVRFLMPYTWLEDGTWDRYKLVRETQETTWVKEIQVVGPAEDVDKLQAQDIDAYIVLTEDDKRKGEPPPRPVKFRFPPELRVRLDGKPPKVKFKLEPRAAGTTPTPP